MKIFLAVLIFLVFYFAMGFLTCALDCYYERVYRKQSAEFIYRDMDDYFLLFLLWFIVLPFLIFGYGCVFFKKWLIAITETMVAKRKEKYKDEE